MLQSFAGLKVDLDVATCELQSPQNSRQHTPSRLRGCGLQLDALRNEPQLLKQTLICERNLKSYVIGCPLSDPSRHLGTGLGRGRPTRERGQM